MSEEAQVDAARLADEELLRHAMNAKGTQFKKIVDDILIDKPGSGITCSLDAAGYLVATPTSKVKAIYRLTTGPNGSRYMLLTMYPVP